MTWARCCAVAGKNWKEAGSGVLQPVSSGAGMKRPLQLLVLVVDGPCISGMAPELLQPRGTAGPLIRGVGGVWPQGPASPWEAAQECGHTVLPARHHWKLKWSSLPSTNITELLATPGLYYLHPLQKHVRTLHKLTRRLQDMATARKKCAYGIHCWEVVFQPEDSVWA